jgi:outer membrane protein TolC
MLGVLLTYFLVLNAPAVEEGALSLEAFLEQVRAKNRDFEISSNRLRSAQVGANEPDLVFSPYGFAGLGFSDEKSTGVLSFVGEGNTSQATVYTLGVAKDWSTGTSTSITHYWKRFDIEGLTNPSDAFWQNQWTLEVEQSLWRDFLGKEKKSAADAAKSRIRASENTESFQLKKILVEAEKVYWAYALAKAARQSVEESLKRTQEILNWNRKRLKLKVIDRGDVLQSEAQLMQIKQNLESAKTRELTAKRHLELNLNENFDSAETYEVSNLNLNLEEVEVPESWDEEKRLDLQAMKELSEAAVLEASSARSSLDPDVSLTASYSGNSADTSFLRAEKEALNNSFRTYEIGVNLQIPLYFARTNNAKEAKDYQAQASRLEYEQARYRMKKAFLDLRSRIQENLQRIKIARELEKTEARKLKNEQKRFRQGRSTSFQVLSFEEDLARAEISLLGLYAQSRQDLAEMSLYE